MKEEQLKAIIYKCLKVQALIMVDKRNVFDAIKRIKSRCTTKW